MFVYTIYYGGILLTKISRRGKKGRNFLGENAVSRVNALFTFQRRSDCQEVFVYSKRLRVYIVIAD